MYNDIFCINKALLVLSEREKNASLFVECFLLISAVSETSEDMLLHFWELFHLCIHNTWKFLTYTYIIYFHIRWVYFMYTQEPKVRLFLSPKMFEVYFKIIEKKNQKFFRKNSDLRMNTYLNSIPVTRQCEYIYSNYSQISVPDRPIW